MIRKIRTVFFILLAAHLATAVWGDSISERTFKYVTRVQKMIEDEAYEEALDACLKIGEYGMPDYDRSAILSLQGNILISLERYREAADAYIEIVKLDAFEDERIQNLKLSIGQILVSIEEYQEGIKYLESWLEKEKNPSPESLITLGSAWTQIGEYDKGLAYVERAIKAAEKPEKSWLDLWLAIYFQKKDYPSCIKVLQEALVYYPDEKKYWSQLSGMYLQNEDDEGALAAMRLAYMQGHLTEEKDLLQLVKLFYFLEIPYNGAKILEESMNKGLVKENETTCKLLAEGWLRSKENDKALEAYQKASRYAHTGEYDLYQAQIYLDTEDWPKASEALERALQRGGLPNEGTGIMMLVLSYFEQNRFDDALDAVRRAKEIPSVAKRAEEWESYLEEEKVAYQYRTAEGDQS